MRIAAALPLALLVLAGCGGSARHTAVPPTSAQPSTPRPAPLDRRSLRPIAHTGSGERRVTLYLGRTVRGETCVGAGVTAGEPRVYCVRRGLEPPVLLLEAGGGVRAKGWGAAVGLAGPDVGSVRVAWQSVTPRSLPLRPLPGTRWRLFAAGPFGDARPDLVEAYGVDGRKLLDDAGLWLASPCEQRNCARLGRQPSWTDVRAEFPGSPAGAADDAVDDALRLRAVTRILAAHPAWLAEVTPWSRCNGTPLGYVVSFRFHRLATFTDTAPFLTFGPGPYSYREGVRETTVLRSPQLDVWVDLNRSEVVGVDGAADGGFELPLRLVREARPAGGPDTPGCGDSRD
jgi:hypothetical protein